MTNIENAELYWLPQQINSQKKEIGERWLTQSRRKRIRKTINLTWKVKLRPKELNMFAFFFFRVQLQIKARFHSTSTHVPFSRATTELPLFTAYNLFQRITMWKTSESSLTLLASNSTFYVPVEDKDQTKMNKINNPLTPKDLIVNSPLKLPHISLWNSC